MKKELFSAVASFTEELLQVPGTQLQHIEQTLRQLREDLSKHSAVLADLDTLIEDAAVAHAEEIAMMKDCIGPEEYYDESEPPFDVVEWMNEVPEHEMQKALTRFEEAKLCMNIYRDMYPEENGLPF